jgi:hypothetical protein
MVRLGHRLRRLEESAGLAGRCPLCKGNGVTETVVTRPDEEPREPLGCPRCRAVGCVKYLRLEGALYDEYGPPSGWDGRVLAEGAA